MKDYFLLENYYEIILQKEANKFEFLRFKSPFSYKYFVTSGGKQKVIRL